MQRNFRLIAIAAGVLTPAICLAQTPPQSKAPLAPKAGQLDPTICADHDTRTTTGQGGDIDAKGPRQRDLGDRLARSGGVICPPSRGDLEMNVPGAPSGRMPVLPPPDSPGGAPPVRPK